ncbi:MAG: chemotaxis protein CheX [Deltaproteobacteria bacterium]|nr:chemotaxis protein CheX [Deltaproteobacteria bacterium]
MTKALQDSISEVFATVFFLVLENPDQPLEVLLAEPAPGWLEGSVEIRGQELMVKFWIWSPAALARELAANIFAENEEDVTPAQVGDAYREMMNMVVGNLLTKVDKEGGWEMSLPQSHNLKAGALGEAARQAADLAAYNFGEHHLLAGWRESAL